MTIRLFTYLDHNVYDFILKSDREKFIDFLKSRYVIIYSLENIQEINRSKGSQEEFYQLLEDLDAYYIDTRLDKNNRITDSADLIRTDPRNILCDNGEEFNYTDMIKSGLNLSLKMLGGKKEISIKEILNDQRSQFSELMKHIDHLSMTAGAGLPENFTEEKLKEFNQVMDNMEEALKEQGAFDENSSGLKRFRDAVGAKPLELNNIEPPNVVKKIWVKIGKNPELQGYKFDLDTITGAKENLAYPGEPVYRFEKIIGTYSFLNMVGYCQDREILKERRFISATSDQSHVAYAAFSNILITRDNYMARKASAAYEHLNINTQIYNMNEFIK